jgi:integrase
VLSLLVGLRTEEARALRWDYVDLDDDPDAAPAVPPHVAVWRSIRIHGETKTERSRRTLGLPQLAVDALRALLQIQAREQAHAEDQWQDTGLVFTTQHGAALDTANVRKMFKRVCKAAGAGDTLDAPRTPDLLRQPHEPQRNQHRGDRSARRPHLHPDNRSRLPP